MKIPVPGFAQMMDFERWHFGPAERVWLDATASGLGRPDSISMDDSTLTHADYAPRTSGSWYSACPCGWTSSPMPTQEAAIGAANAHRITDCSGRTINGETMF